MKIEITKGGSPLSEFFSQPLSIEGEAEMLKLAFSDELLALMKKHSISKAELARRMEIQPSRVTAMLSGDSNLTIDTMVRAAHAVGASLQQKLVPAGQKARKGKR